MAATLMAAAAHAAIAYAIIAGLVASGQLRTNRLGVATALLFVTAAGYFLIVGLELLVPHGTRLRDGLDWHLAAWAILTAAAGVYYLALRHSRGGAAHGAQMFEDLEARERQALEINDT